MIILDKNIFCFYCKEEIGIAVKSHFASTAWIKSDAIFNRITGKSFGWLDSQLGSFRDDKRDMTRPSDKEIENLISPKLLDYCVKNNYIKL